MGKTPFGAHTDEDIMKWFYGRLESSLFSALYMLYAASTHDYCKRLTLHGEVKQQQQRLKRGFEGHFLRNRLKSSAREGPVRLSHSA
jgi:hypothetical protein